MMVGNQPNLLVHRHRLAAAETHWPALCGGTSVRDGYKTATIILVRVGGGGGG